MKKHELILWLSFAVLILFRLGKGSDIWLILTLIACGISVFLLIKNRKPSRKYVFLSVLFAILSSFAYLPTLLSSLAVFSVMEKQGGFEMRSKKGKHPVLISVILAIAVGAVLSVINMIISGAEIRFDFSFGKLL